MSLSWAERGPQNTLVFAVRCDVCNAPGRGSEERLRAQGWYFESPQMTPHLCAACAEVREHQLHGDRVHSREPPAPAGALPRPF